MSKVCLIVVFNHRYDRNLQSISEMYGKRFHDIFVLMPFYDGEDIEGITIIPVYESSFFFSGYFAQAIKLIGKKYEHYVVIGDDLVLNPYINENNIIEYLNLHDGQSYIKDIRPLCNSSGVNAQRLNRYILSPFVRNSGVEYKNILPSADEAFRYIRDKGYVVSERISFSWLIQVIKQGGIKRIGRSIVDTISMLISNKGTSLPYPLYKIYSDFFIISGRDIDKVVQYFGVFAAMGLFVEVAVPTAMVLSCNDILTEKMIDKHGVEMWEKNEIDEVAKKNEYKIDKLFHNFPEDVIYYHPIKLSKWK